jgi:hypothetical protein
MRPKFSVWSDYGAPAHKHWMSAPKQGTRTSIGPMILLAAVMVVAGVIGISGIYPQIIDAEWVHDTGAHPTKMSLSSPHATRKRSGIIAAIPLGAVTTGEAAVSSRAGPAPDCLNSERGSPTSSRRWRPRRRWLSPRFQTRRPRPKRLQRKPHHPSRPKSRRSRKRRLCGSSTSNATTPVLTPSMAAVGPVGGGPASSQLAITADSERGTPTRLPRAIS